MCAKKKYGILTFQNAENAGAVLQCLALQQAIDDLGYEAEIVNLKCTAVEDPYYKIAPKANLKGHLRWLLMSKWREKQHDDYKNFRCKYLHMSESLTEQELPRIVESYDAVIVGSDQVWNTKITNGSLCYFLNFDAPLGFKRAYAVSLGTSSFPPELEEDCLALINDFANLNFREEVSADYVRRRLGRETTTACDPTLLLPREYWEELVIKPSIKKPYVLVFSTGSRPDEDWLAFAREIANSKNIDLVVVDRAPSPISDAKVFREVSPQELLGLICYAETVVTASFHGCCFSILFEREFYFWKSEKSVDVTRRSRIENLLEVLGLSSRAVSASAHPVYEDIDWVMVRPKLLKYREESLNTLSSILAIGS